jgi:hypothetical protein
MLYITYKNNNNKVIFLRSSPPCIYLTKEGKEIYYQESKDYIKERVYQVHDTYFIFVFVIFIRRILLLTKVYKM